MTTVSPLARARPNGGSIAAFVGAAFGLLALGIVVVLTDVNTAAKDAVFALGKAWIPGAQGIGPYSGKETIALLAWLGSWGGLHLALRHRQVDTRAWFGIAMGMLLVAILLVWPPVWALFE